MNEKLKRKELTDVIICCFYTVYNTLGYGFLEKVYENALLHELMKRGILASPQSPISVFYDSKKAFGTRMNRMHADKSNKIKTKACLTHQLYGVIRVHPIHPWLTAVCLSPRPPRLRVKNRFKDFL